MIDNVSTKEIEDAIRIHWKLQLGSYFSSVHELGGATYNLGDPVTDYYWNYAGLIRAEGGEENEVIDRVMEFAKLHDRVPAIYIDPSTQPNSFVETIKQRGFSAEGDEIWMFYPDGAGASEPAVDSNGLDISVVGSDSDLSQFLDVFNEAYEMLEDGETTTPYGDSLVNAYNSPPDGVEIKHFIGRHDGVAVSIASTYLAGDVAGIYNVGTPEAERRKGYGTFLSQHAINYAVKARVRKLILQTDLDSPAEKLYTKLGFKPAFSAGIWSTEA